MQERISMRAMKMAAIGVLGLEILLGASCSSTKPAAESAYHPQINPADFSATVDNPYFPLVPGTTCKYVEKDGDETNENEVTVTSETKVVMGVKCVVVH